MSKSVAWPLFNLALAVALGAFGAHALESRLDPHAFEVYKTSRDYHMWLGLAWLALSLSPLSQSGRKAINWVFPVGLALFCGSLYALAISGVKVLGAITPLGGVAWIGGLAWLGMLAVNGRLLVD